MLAGPRAERRHSGTQSCHGIGGTRLRIVRRPQQVPIAADFTGLQSRMRSGTSRTSVRERASAQLAVLLRGQRAEVLDSRSGVPTGGNRGREHRRLHRPRGKITTMREYTDTQNWERALVAPVA